MTLRQRRRDRATSLLRSGYPRLGDRHGAWTGGRQRRALKGFLDSLLTHPEIGFGLVGRDFRYLRVSPVLAALNGVPAEDHIGRTVREVLPELADDIERLVSQVADTGQPVDIEIAGETPAAPGEVRHFSARYIPVRDAAGEVMGIAALITDETQHKRAEAQFRALFESAPGAILALDPDRTITRANPAAEEMFGWPADELAGRSADVLVEGVSRLEHGRRSELAGRRRDGSAFPVEVSIGEPASGTRTLFVADITDRDRLEAELAHQALHDPLTGLPNRTLFADRLEHALRGAPRHGRRWRCCSSTSTASRSSTTASATRPATSCCSRSAPRLREAVRASDTVARFGGDEFVVLCEASPTSARRCSSRSAIAAPAGRGRSAVRDRDIYVTAQRRDRGVGARTRRRRRSCATPTPRCTAPRTRGGGHAVFDDLRRAPMSMLRLEGALRRALRERRAVACLPADLRPRDRRAGRGRGARALERPERGPVPRSSSSRSPRRSG